MLLFHHANVSICTGSCFFFFLFLATPMVYGSSQARDRIQATALTYTTAAATPDP